MAGNHAKLCLSRAIGVYIGKSRVTLTEVGTTIRGSTILAQSSEAIDDVGPAAALKKLLTDHLTPRELRSIPVRLGLRPQQTFFMTCTGNFGPQDEPSLDKLFAACGASAELKAETMAADFVKPGKVKMATGQAWNVGTCRKSLAEELFSAVQDIGVKEVRLQPAALCLLHTVRRQDRKRKGWNVAIHVFLNDSVGLAVLAVSGLTVLWREFALASEDRVKGISSAVRVVRCHAWSLLQRPNVDGVIVHGPAGASLVDGFDGDIGIPIVVAEEDGLSEARFSHGLAQAARSEELPPFDLFRSLRSAPTILSMFPWKRAGCVVVAAVVMTFLMWNKVTAMNRQYEQLRRQNAERQWTQDKRTGEIKNERKQLMSEVSAVSKFVSTRVIWSNYLRDLPTRVPSNAGLSNLGGFCELKETSKKQASRRTKKSLTLRGMTRFAKGQAAPEEIDAFLESLRNVDLLKKDFSQVQLAEIRWRREGSSEVAMFTVVALPGKKTGGGKESEE
jgi:hypothetical protein